MAALYSLVGELAGEGTLFGGSFNYNLQEAAMNVIHALTWCWDGFCLGMVAMAWLIAWRANVLDRVPLVESHQRYGSLA